MSIRTKLTLILLVFGMVPLAVFGTLAFLNAKHALESSRTTELESVAEFKTCMIENFIAERKKSVAVLQENPIMKKYIHIPVKPPDEDGNPIYADAERELDSLLKPLQETFGYNGITLVSREGRILYVSNKSGDRESAGRPVLEASRTALEEGKGEIYFSEIMRGRGGVVGQRRRVWQVNRVVHVHGVPGIILRRRE